MAVDSAVSQTAVEAWDKRWATSEGRADWLEPHPAVVAILPELRARGAKRVLDLGCGVGRHALLLAEHGFDVEAIDGSPAGLAVMRERAAARGLPVWKVHRPAAGVAAGRVPELRLRAAHTRDMSGFRSDHGTGRLDFRTWKADRPGAAASVPCGARRLSKSCAR